MSKKILLPVGFLLALSLSACSQIPPSKSGDSPPIQSPAQVGFNFTETEFDFGTIKQSGGKVQHQFQFTYDGREPIEITATPSSCACTEATVSKTRFQPGESGTLTVTFNPNLHGEPAGKFFKTSILSTDPPLSPAPEVKIWAQIDLDLGPDYFELKGQYDDDDEEISLNPAT